MWFTFNFRACFFHPVCLQQGSLQYAELNQNIGHHGDQGDTVDQHIEHVDHEGHSDQSVQQDHLVETETDPAVNGEWMKPWPRTPPCWLDVNIYFSFIFPAFFFTLMQLEKSHDTEGNYKICFYGEVGLNGVQRQTAQQIHLLWKANKTFVSLFKIEFSVNIWIWHE